MIDERELREVLRRRADGVSTTPGSLPRAVRRAHRRVARTGVLSAILAAALALTVVGGVRALRGSPAPEPLTPSPADPTAVSGGTPCQAFIAGLDYPKIQYFGITAGPSGRRKALRASRHWTENIARIIRCTADHGAIEGGDDALVQHAAAMDQAYAAFGRRSMERTARIAMTAITEDYPTSCYVPLAKEYLRTGTIDVNLIQACL